MPRLLKILLSIGLITFLVLNIDWQQLPQQLGDFRWGFAALAFAVLAIQFPVSGLKWFTALHVFTVRLPVMLLTRFYCIAHFVGQFLPTSIGGDAYRIYRTMPLVEPRSRAVTSIVLERVAGLGALLCLGIVGAFKALGKSWLASSYLSLLAIGALIGIALVALLLFGWLSFVLVRLEKFGWYVSLRKDFRVLLQARWRWIPFIAMSFGFQLLAVLAIYLLFAGAGSPIGLPETALIAAVTGLAGMLPISINGIGVAEGSMVGAAVALGVQYDDAVIAALLLRVLVVPLSLACGVIYATEAEPGSKRTV